MKKKQGKQKKGVILVGHGGVPKDCPYEWVTKLKRFEAQRSVSGASPSQEEVELDHRIRNWPRNPETDPYKAGLESLASHLKPLLGDTLFSVAYNEFCSPTLEEAVEDMIKAGAEEISVVPSMFTPGGSHSEFEIPKILKEMRNRYPSVTLQYAWPFDLNQVAKLLSEQLSSRLKN
jgi:sirohydrochlorin cobaltochelatase